MRSRKLKTILTEIGLIGGFCGLLSFIFIMQEVGRQPAPKEPSPVIALSEDPEAKIPSYKSVTTSTRKPVCLEPDNERNLSENDKYLLAKMIMAEAESEPFTGQALVGLVILNRVDSPYFPDTVEGVIYEEGQFSPIDNGRWEAVEPDDSCKAAVDFIGTGWDESQGATYFESITNDSEWHEENLEYLFTKGGHKFYREFL